MTTKLTIGTRSRGGPFTLPLEEAVTNRYGVIARTGGGKTYIASVIVEELLKRGVQVVIFDPFGVWWGLRSSADGKGPGFPVVLFGDRDEQDIGTGREADVILAETMGARLAELVASEGFSAILSLEHFSHGERRRFTTDFLERLFRLRLEAPLHIVLDEADLFAAQWTDKGDKRMLGAVDNIQRRGRARGIGTTVITQRPATLHKDVMSQIEVLIARQITEPRDQKAVREWIRGKDERNREDEFMKSLAGLEPPAAWVWSPSWLKVFEPIEVRDRETFDSSSTPRFGKKRASSAPAATAKPDLVAIEKALEDAIEKAKADDPVALRARVKFLERELEKTVSRDRQNEAIAAAAEDLERLRQVEAELETMRAALRRSEESRLSVFQSLGAIGEMIGAEPWKGAGTVLGLLQEAGRIIAGARGELNAHPIEGSLLEAPTRPRRRPISGPFVPPERDRAFEIMRQSVEEADRMGRAGENGELPKAQAAVVAALHHQGGRGSWTRTAFLAGYPPEGTSMRDAASGLRTAGILEGGKGDEQIRLVNLPKFPELAVEAVTRRADDLPGWWAQQSGKAAAEILRELVKAYPKTLSRAELERLTPSHYPATGTSMRDGASELRRRGLLVGKPDQWKAADELMQ